MKRTCVQCGKDFELSDSEIAFYRNKELELPKRCKECRQKNKNSSSAQSTNLNQYDRIPDHYNKITTGSSSKGRFRAIVLGIIVIFILLFVGGKYARHLFSVRDDNASQVQTDIEDRRTKPQSQTEIDDQGSKSQLQTEINDISTENKLPTEADDQKAEIQSQTDKNDAATDDQYQFRKEEYLTEHFEKHGSEFGYATKEEYLKGANAVILSSTSIYKQEADDGDSVFFLESTGGLVIVSTDGYIRTYFKPEDGIEYFNKQ